MAWHDFIVRAYLCADDHAVYLAGLPDVPSSLPNSRCLEILDDSEAIPATALAGKSALGADPAAAKGARVPAAGAGRERGCPLPPVAGGGTPASAPATRGRPGWRKPCPTCPGRYRKPIERLRELAKLDRLRATAQAVYRLRVVLQHTEPPIWRDIQVHNCTLDQLHKVLQAAMGWEGNHPYLFKLGDVQYTVLPQTVRRLPSQIGDAEHTYLNQIIPLRNKPFSFKYLYDLNDEWGHGITVEGIIPLDARRRYPLCLDGERACPPEGCGGVERYVETLQILADPAHVYHDNVVKWLGHFDPQAFSAKAATRRMRQDRH